MLLEVSEALAEESRWWNNWTKRRRSPPWPQPVWTVKEIFAGVDIKRRPGFRVQRTESDKLGAVTGRPGYPILPPQIVE